MRRGVMVLGLLVMTGILLSLVPGVQDRLVSGLTTRLSIATGFSIDYESVYIKWFDELSVKGLRIRDPQDSVVIWVPDAELDFNIISLIGGTTINLDELRLKEPRVHLVRSPDSAYFNIDYFMVRLKEYLNPQKKPPKPLKISSLNIINGTFSLNDQKRDSIAARFDQFHFRIDRIDAVVSDFKTASDTIDLQVRTLTGENSTYGLNIDQLKGNFMMCNLAMELSGLYAEIGNSVLKDSIKFLYDSRANLSYFQDSVTIVAHLDESVIDTRDLAIFAPQLVGLADKYAISGGFQGTVGRFAVDDLEFKFGNRSLLRGEVSFNGLPNVEETFIGLKFNRSRIGGSDLIKYVNAPNLNLISKFGLVDFEGEFLGFLNDFVANGSFRTDLGRVVSDIKLELDEDPAKSRYDGRITLKGFDAGELINEPDLFQRVDMSGEINGTGLTLGTADFQLKAKFTKLGFKHYNYQNIVTNARLTEEFFQGLVEIKDPNLQFISNASIDLRDNKNQIKVNADLDIAFLKNLKLTDQDLSISSIVSLDLHGLHIDSIVGTIGMSNIFATLDGRNLYIDSIEVESRLENGFRTLSWSSDGIDVELAGSFDYTTAFTDLAGQVAEYRLILLNQRDSLENYYAQKGSFRPEPYQLHYRVDLRDINPVLSLVAPGWSISPKTSLEGDIMGGDKSLFTLQSRIDTLRFNEYQFYSNEIGFSTTKDRDTSDVLAFLYLFSEHPDFKSIHDFHNLSFEGVWEDDHINWRSGLFRTSENQARVSGKLMFNPNFTEVTVNPSDIVFMGNRWEFIQGNRVTFDNIDYQFTDFGVHNQGQRVALNGIISPDSAQVLKFDMRNFGMENLGPLVQKKLSGTANGYASMRNLMNSPTVESELTISSFRIGKFLVGELTNQALWDPDISKFRMNFEVIRDQSTIISINGLLDPLVAENQLDLDATFQKANLNIAEPFVSETFSQLGGVASGEFRITGDLRRPILNGRGRIEEGQARVNYLNTRYTFNGVILLEENEIGVRDLLVVDDQANIGRLNGGIFHDGFRNLALDLTGEVQNFNVLKTSLNDNQLFYGDMNVTGTVNFLGTLNNLTISAKATTEKGTRIFIPMSTSTAIEQKDFIQFVSFRDSTYRDLPEEEKSMDLKGIKLKLDLEVTPDAYAEIIFDIKTGDIIRGRGIGNFQLQAQGDEFNMFGGLSMVEGSYNFTLYSLINKEFAIEPGSKITWYGDPYEGILDIKANYRQYASMAPILADTSLSSSPDVRRAYPTTVILEMEGPLLSPEIDFDIVVRDFPQNIVANGQAISLQTEYDAFRNKILTDEQELKRQVFSLIILKRFSIPNSFELGGGGTLGSSVSEFISNQLFYWMSQVDENLEISVDLGQLDDEAFNSLQLRLSYTFLEGRLRVTGDGGQNVGGLAGAVSVESLITEDGQLRVKLSLGSNYATANSSIDNTYNYNTYRGSLVWSKSFPDFSKQLRKAREKAEKREKEETQPTSSDLKEEEEIQTSPSGDGLPQ